MEYDIPAGRLIYPEPRIKPNARLSDKSGMKPGTALETDDKNTQKNEKAGWK